MPVPVEVIVTDQEFEALKKRIQETMILLDILQEQHRKETGKRYVISGPLEES